MMVYYAIENHKDDDRYHYINLISWLKGCRLDCPYEELENEEKIYWNNLNK